MATYFHPHRKRPIVVQAVQWHGQPDRDGLLRELIEKAGVTPAGEWGSDKALIVRTLEGEMRCEVGDWIVRGVAGEYYPVKSAIFEATYDPESALRHFRGGYLASNPDFN